MKDSSSPAAGVTTRNVTEHWGIVGTAGSHALLVYDTISYMVRGKKKTQLYYSEYPCDPI